MIDPRKVTPLLTNTSVDRELGRGPNGTVYQVTRRLDGRRLALKHIAIPASDAETKALIYAGAVKNEAGAQRYYSALVQGIKTELLLLNGIQNAPNLLKFRGYQVDQKVIGIGFDVYLLSNLCRSLPEFLLNNAITRLQAANLGHDLCAALEQLRSGGLIHKDVRPNNIYLGEGGRFLLGDLGLVRLEDLSYSSMPEQLITEYTAPEVLPADAPLSETMDIYSVGMILYEIYNGFSLPEGMEGGRTPEELPAPAYADPTMGEIILKACAYDPADRYQDPAEMREALALYLQRSDVSSEPLVPTPDLEESAEVDVSAIAGVVEAGQASAHAASQEEPEEAPEEPIQEPEPDPAIAPRPPLRDLSPDELLGPNEGNISVEEFLASLKDTPGLEILSMDSSGNTSVAPGYETEATMPEDTEYVDSADGRVYTPTVDIPEEPLPFDGGEAEPDLPQEEAPAETDPAAYDYEGGETDEPVEPAGPRMPADDREPYDDTYDDSYDDGYDDEDYEDYESGGGWKAVLIALLVLLILAGGAFALYTFKTDTIDAMQSQVLSSSTVEITAQSRKGSAMEVVCSNAAGEVARQPLTDEGATFTGLDPSSTYGFTLSSTEGKLLLGGRSLEVRTAQMTNLTNFTASSLTAVSARLAVAGTGSQPDSWIITCTGDNGDLISVTATDLSQPVEIEGLTPATTYTAEIARGDGDQLGGTTTCTFTTMDYTVLTSFEATAVTTDSVTVQWEFSGYKPTEWTVDSQGSDGTSVTQQVSGTECVLDGLTSGVTYDISLSCPSLRPTELSAISVGIPTVTVTSLTAIQNDDGDIQVEWAYESDVTPAQWSVSCNYVSDTAVPPTLLTAENSTLTLEDPIPEAEYTFTLETADDLRVGGETTSVTIVTGSAPDFTEFGASDAELSLYVLDEATGDPAEEPTDEFTTGEHLAFAVEVNYDATDEDKNVRTLYIIRSDSGTPVYVYRNDDPGRSWSGSWTTARHTGDLPDMPQKPGRYTLEIYFDGGFLASAEFTVNAE